MGFTTKLSFHLSPTNRKSALYPGWKDGEAELRELRKQVTFAVCSEEDDFDKVVATVESLFMLLEKAFRK